MITFLSHALTPETPGYGGKKPFRSRMETSIEQGASANSQRWEFSNHIGTHIDLPYHFSDLGKKIEDYPPEFWVFQHPHLIDLPVKAGELIGVGDWTQRIRENVDLILIRTGFEKHRNEQLYWAFNPGLALDLGIWLRKHRPSVRAIGIDLISVTSFQHRPEGRLAHRAFLSPDGDGSPIVLIEDMALAHLGITPRRVLVAPLRVTGADGTPVTVFAELD